MLTLWQMIGKIFNDIFNLLFSNFLKTFRVTLQELCMVYIKNWWQLVEKLSFDFFSVISYVFKHLKPYQNKRRRWYNDCLLMYLKLAAGAMKLLKKLMIECAFPEKNASSSRPSNISRKNNMSQHFSNSTNKALRSNLG